MVAAWNAWEGQMLPEIRESFTESFTARKLADHVGARPTSLDPDLGSWP